MVTQKTNRILNLKNKFSTLRTQKKKRLLPILEHQKHQKLKINQITGHENINKFKNEKIIIYIIIYIFFH